MKKSILVKIMLLCIIAIGIYFSFLYFQNTLFYVDYVNELINSNEIFSLIEPFKQLILKSFLYVLLCVISCVCAIVVWIFVDKAEFKQLSKEEREKIRCEEKRVKQQKQEERERIRREEKRAKLQKQLDELNEYDYNSEELE